MNIFLKSARSAVHALSRRKLIFVIGNEACDLDSTACALAYGFYKHMKLNDEIDVIPICQINRGDMILRSEVVYWLEKCNLHWNDLIYLDDVLDQTLCDLNTRQIELILVDHNFLTNDQLIVKKWPVLEIIDHHQENPNYPITGTPYKRIDFVGSCATLITFEIIENMDGSDLPFELWKLLYGAILLDTNGLSETGKRMGKLTHLDYSMASHIEDLIYSKLFVKGQNRESLFMQLESSRFDVHGFSTWDLLRRDLKIASCPNVLAKIACATISGMDFQILLNLPDFTESAERLRVHCDTDLIVCITIGYPVENKNLNNYEEDKKQRRRGIIIYLTNSVQYELYEKLVQFVCDPIHNLMLEQIYLNNNPELGYLCTAIINNHQITRKAIMPILVLFLSQFKLNPPAALDNDQTESTTVPPSSH